MVRKDSTSGYVPVVKWGAFDVELECSWSAAWPSVGIPSLYFLRIYNVLEPITFGDQPRHVLPHTSLKREESKRG